MGVLPLYHMCAYQLLLAKSSPLTETMLADGMIILLQHTMYLGGTVVLMPKFDLPKYCEAIQTYRATVRLLPPPPSPANPSRRRLSSSLPSLSASPKAPS